jgi:hypothetical protein
VKRIRTTMMRFNQFQVRIFVTLVLSIIHHCFYCEAFMFGKAAPLWSRNDNSVPKRRCRQENDQYKNRYYSSGFTTTSSSLEATTRRQSFGDLLGSTLALPVMVNTATSTTISSLPANAADDYPFKVGTKLYIFITAI